MRKYCFLSILSMISIHNVYAYDGAAGQFEALAYVLMADEISCSQQLGLGAYIKELGEISVTLDANGKISNTTGDNITLAVGQPAICSLSNGTFTDASRIMLPDYEVECISIETGDKATISNFTKLISEDGKSVNIGATLSVNPTQPFGCQVSLPIMYAYE